MIGGMRAQHIALAGPAQLHLDSAHTIDRVSGHPVERYTRRNRPRDHLGCDLRLGDKAHITRHMSCFPPLRTLDPLLGQIELTVDEGAALVRYISGKYPDLAVGKLAERPTLLAGYTLMVVHMTLGPRSAPPPTG